MIVKTVGVHDEIRREAVLPSKRKSSDINYSPQTFWGSKLSK